MPVPDIAEAELAVLRRLWDVPRSTIRELTDHLYPAGTTAHYATVQKLLERLEAKGCVTRDADTTPHHFSATITRLELAGSRLRKLADQLCEGSIAPLITHLIDARELTPREIEELRALVSKAPKARKR